MITSLWIQWNERTGTTRHKWWQIDHIYLVYIYIYTLVRNIYYMIISISYIYILYNYYVYLYFVFRFLPFASRKKGWAPEAERVARAWIVASRHSRALEGWKNGFLLLKGKGVMELWSYWISENEVHLHGKNMDFYERWWKNHWI